MDDEKIYNEILEELRANGPRQGLWAKCFTEAKGNDNTAKALYFKYRSQQLEVESSSAAPESYSTELAPINVPIKITDTIDKKINNRALFAFVVCLALGCIVWIISEDTKNKNEIRKAEDRQEIERFTKQMEEMAVKNKEFKNLYSTLPDFNFDKERQNCSHINNTLSQADYRSCVLDLLEDSNAKITDIKNKFLKTTNDSGKFAPVSQTFTKYDEIQESWCDTFIGLTWGQGNGIVTGVAGCKITLNTLLGKTLRAIAANYSNLDLSSASFTKNANSNLYHTCNNEECLKKIQRKTIEYQLKIETFIKSKELTEKYGDLSESTRLIWLQSIEDTHLNTRILSNLICKELATLNRYNDKSHSSTECEISLGLFWLDEFSNQYENFQKK